MPRGTKPPIGALTQEVAALLRAQRGRLGGTYTQAYLAKKVGVSPTTAGRILKGQNHIDMQQLEALCEALNLDMLEVVRQAVRVTKGREHPAERHYLRRPLARPDAAVEDR